MKFDRTVDVGILRPYLSDGGKAFCKLSDGRVVPHDPCTSPVNRAMLTKEQWVELDRIVKRGFECRVPLTQLLIDSGCVFDDDSPENPEWSSRLKQEYAKPRKLYGRTTLEQELRTDAEGGQHLLLGLPLPITYTDHDSVFHGGQFNSTCDKRWLLNGINFEAGARRVGEKVEAAFLGTEAIVGGEPQVYGLLNHPLALNCELVVGVNAADGLMQTINRMCSRLVANGFPGPFVVLHPHTCDMYMDDDFVGDHTVTVRQQLERGFKIDGKDVKVTRVMRTDFVKESKLMVFQMTNDVIQAVNCLWVTVVQWENLFKVLACVVPNIRCKAGTVGVAVTTIPDSFFQENCG